MNIHPSSTIQKNYVLNLNASVSFMHIELNSNWSLRKDSWIYLWYTGSSASISLSLSLSWFLFSLSQLPYPYPDRILLFLVSFSILVVVIAMILIVVIAFILPLFWCFWRIFSDTKNYDKGSTKKYLE